MNNTGKFYPPPGYSVAGHGGFGNTARRPYYAQQNNTATSHNSQQGSALVDVSTYTYNQQQIGGNQGSYGNSPLNQSPNVPSIVPTIDPRMFTLPPPPPPVQPSVPYTTTMTSSSNSFVYNPFSVPPPTIARQYPIVSHQQENYHSPQYQKPNTSGFNNRGGNYNYNARKRKMLQETEFEATRKTPRKKKKPLSQNIPSRRDWSVGDARRALEVEREFNKRHKSQSLIIKFPDLELNRDIVSKFHPAISSVHFQQPSTPRFCFVTLKDSSKIEEVIKELNKIKFGDGYLTAEPKKDREEDLNIGPEDIDPLTLYVGNLAQEVTVEDVVKSYPRNKRIDIGFAKKMKYTRYAFISFRTVDDAIKAFQNTHATEMYNKSLIVRFRRLHGTVGLPGEPKPQNHQKKSGANGSTDDIIEDLTLDNCPRAVKEELPDISYNYESDGDEDYEEELLYSESIRNIVRTSLDAAVASAVKREPVDYDMYNSYQSYEPNENDSSRIPINDSHVPLLEPKIEDDVIELIVIKDEPDDGFENNDNNETLRRARRNRNRSADADHNNGPVVEISYYGDISD